MADLTTLYNSLRRNTDNSFYLDLVKLLEFKLDTVKNQLIDAVEINDMKRLQGRAAELKEMLTALQRKPIVRQQTGAFDQ